MKNSFVFFFCDLTYSKNIWMFLFVFFGNNQVIVFVFGLWNLDEFRRVEFMRWQWWLQLQLLVQCWSMWFAWQLHLVNANRWYACGHAFGNDPMFYYLHRMVFYGWWYEEPLLANGLVPWHGVFAFWHQKSSQRTPFPMNEHWLRSMWSGYDERSRILILAFPNLFLELPEIYKQIEKKISLILYLNVAWILFNFLLPWKNTYCLGCSVFTRFLVTNLGYVYKMRKNGPKFLRFSHNFHI